MLRVREITTRPAKPPRDSFNRARVGSHFTAAYARGDRAITVTIHARAYDDFLWCLL